MKKVQNTILFHFLRFTKFFDQNKLVILIEETSSKFLSNDLSTMLPANCSFFSKTVQMLDTPSVHQYLAERKTSNEANLVHCLAE